MNRVVNILFALDCFVFALLTLGGSYPSESISSAAYRAEKNGVMFGNVRPLIDWVFLHFAGQQNHCEMAYSHVLLNLPPDERG